jgi:hypothetical protein
VPRAAYEAMRRAVRSLVQERLVLGRQVMDRNGRMVTFVELSDAGRRHVEQASPDYARWVSREARTA